MVVDRLLETGAPLADVVWLYAYGPPDWLAPTHEEDERFRLLLVTWCQATGDSTRGEDIRIERIDPHAELKLRKLRLPQVDRPRRDQKRRVLALFPEVAIEIEIPSLAETQRHTAPFRYDQPRKVFLQILAAPDWIPPQRIYTSREEIIHRLETHGVTLVSHE